ncbi:MAG: CHRD domain-containing protein [Gemmatimonadales bacterium]
MRVTRVFTVLAAVALLGVACDDDVTGIPADVEIYRAELNGANEVPALPTPTTATGQATITVLDSLVSWRVEVTGIENVNIGHIHEAPEGEAGDVILNLLPTPGDYPGTTVIAIGSEVVSADVLAAIRAGNGYVNIHTSDNIGGTDPQEPGDYPGGEIRGQLRRL